MSMLDPQTVNMFHFSGPKHTTPNCPVDMAANFNPSKGAQSYSRSTKDCSRNAYYNIPFFLNRPRIFEEWSVNAHEARPGHHTQVTFTQQEEQSSAHIKMSPARRVSMHVSFDFRSCAFLA